MSVVAFVHAKGNSTRVPSKNLRVLGDKPLFGHAIENALNSDLVDLVVIDSDSDEILELGEDMGAVALKRSSELATNATTGDDLMYWQASNYAESDIVLQVIPTSPFIAPRSIDNSIQLLQTNEDINSVFGVHNESLYQWVDGRPLYYRNGKILNSFDMDPIVYETTGLYVNRTQYVLDYKRRLDVDKYMMYELSKLESIDINTEEDFEFAKIIMRGL